MHLLAPFSFAASRDACDTASPRRAAPDLCLMVLSLLVLPATAAPPSWCCSYGMTTAVLLLQACSKLTRDLPEGAVVIDYTGAMGKAGLCSRLEVEVEVAVGWNKHQCMHAYVKGTCRST